MSDEDKEHFRDAARIGAQATYKYVDETFNSNIDTFRAAGVEVVEDVDLDAFREAVAPVYESDYNSMFGEELIESIRATQ